ncbi:DUF418 domain-containing protein [Lysinibacillus endophyticus]|uniref:DUF418 domain-containing protein n=2 Tax=Ureibacillus endophyticus TaxID=1978490 RepID=UPI003136A37C
MLLIGFLHATLLLADIIGAYGLIALLFAGLFVRLSNKSIIVIAILLLIVVGALGTAVPRGFDTLNMEMTSTTKMADPIDAAISRMFEWMFYTPFLSFQLIPGVLIGMLVARFQFIDYPQKHRKYLINAALLGLFISTAGAIPMALMSSLFWTSYSEIWELSAKALHTFSGFAGGVGWTALIGLMAIKLEQKRGTVTKAIVALGQRSLSFYIFQSFLFVLILAPYAGGLGGHISQLGSDVVSVFVWVVSVIIANILHKRSIRGPFETLLRKKSTL